MGRGADGVRVRDDVSDGVPEEDGVLEDVGEAEKGLTVRDLVWPLQDCLPTPPQWGRGVPSGEKGVKEDVWLGVPVRVELGVPVVVVVGVEVSVTVLVRVAVSVRCGERVRIAVAVIGAVPE